jgi:acyl-CoA synthetase (NDP forming)
VTLLFFPLPKGRNATLVGHGGGNSVIITDMFEKNSLYVPQFPQCIKDHIRSYTPVAGNILRNPIDYGQNIREIENFAKTVSIVTEWDGCDFLILFFRAGSVRLDDDIMLMGSIDKLHDVIVKNSKKPTAFILSPTPETVTLTYQMIQNLAATGMPVYSTFDGAARGINLVLAHYRI